MLIRRRRLYLLQAQYEYLYRLAVRATDWLPPPVAAEDNGNSVDCTDVSNDVSNEDVDVGGDGDDDDDDDEGKSTHDAEAPSSDAAMNDGVAVAESEDEQHHSCQIRL